MTLRKSTLVVKDAVYEGWHLLQKSPLPLPAPNLNKTYVVGAALLIAGSIVAAVFHFSGNGNISVLQQRIIGQIHLSTGDYSARPAGELNQLSWENGLDMMAALDTVNNVIGELETLQTTSPVNQSKLIRTQKQLKHAVAQVHTLLRDRKTILQAAEKLKVNNLYTPVYHAYLQETMSKVSALTLAETKKPQGVTQ